MTVTLDPIVVRAYRTARREGVRAEIALARAKAAKRGRDLVGWSDDDRDDGRSWHLDLGVVVVDVRQIPDPDSCDCWEWAKENPRDDGREDEIPDHGHFGIVATASMMGREIIHESCWGYVWDWPGQDDDVELAWAWDDIASNVIDRARKAAAELPEWVQHAVMVRETTR